MNISQCAAQNAKGCSLKEQGRRHVGLSFIAKNAHNPLGFFLISKRSPFGGHKMKMIVDGKYLESDENDTCEYWDIEDRFYEQYKEMKMGD